MIRIAILFLLASPLLGCTKGSVRDARTPGRGLGGAEVAVSRFPPRITSERDNHFVWPAVGLSPDYVARTEATLFGGRDNFGFGPRDGGERIPQGHWYRFEVSRAGYEPAVHYRFHPGYGESCETFTCPAGSGRNCCHREDFVLWPADAPHLEYPDLIVDERPLRNETYFQCVTLPVRDRSRAAVDLVALRTSLRVANVGDGPLALESMIAGGHCAEARDCARGFECDAGICAPKRCYADDGLCPEELICGPDGRCSGSVCDVDEECPSHHCLARAGFAGTCMPSVLQHVRGANGMADDDITLPAMFETRGSEFHLQRFTTLSLVRADPACEDAESRDPACVVASRPTSGCIAGTEEFDAALAGPEKPSSSKCGSSIQVLDAGRSTTLRRDLALVLGSPTETLALLRTGSYRVEATVDPDERLTERPTLGSANELTAERQNNTARVPLRSPPLESVGRIEDDLCRASVSSGSCPDCVPVLDCSFCQPGYRNDAFHPCVEAFNLDHEQQEMCAGFLRMRSVQ